MTQFHGNVALINNDVLVSKNGISYKVFFFSSSDRILFIASESCASNRNNYRHEYLYRMRRNSLAKISSRYVGRVARAIIIMNNSDRISCRYTVVCVPSFDRSHLKTKYRIRQLLPFINRTAERIIAF